MDPIRTPASGAPRPRRRATSVAAAVAALALLITLVAVRDAWSPDGMVRSTRSSDLGTTHTTDATDATTSPEPPPETFPPDTFPPDTFPPDETLSPDDTSRPDTFPPADDGPDAGLADPNLFADLLPALRSMPAPDGLVRGTRLTYYATAASVPGSYHEYVEAESGDWVDPDTGDRYDQVDIPGAAGHGYNQVTVTELNESVAVLSVRAYGLSDLALDSPVRTISWGGVVGIPGAGADYWLHPDVLAQVEEVVTPSLKVLRMPYSIDGQEFSTIWVQSLGETGNLTWVYDTETGLLLHTAGSTVGPPITGPVAAGDGRDGSTFLTQSTIVAARDTALPWSDAGPPAWLGSIERIEYAGSITVGLTGTPAAVLDAWLTVERRMSGSTWGRFIYTRTMSTEVTPSVTESIERVDGPGQVGALWIPPDGLADLATGQQIDHDPVTQTTVLVASVDPGNTVTIFESGPGEETELVYDVATGLLVASTTTDLVLGTRVAYEFAEWV